MPAIIVKETHSNAKASDIQYRLINDENEKRQFVCQYRQRSKAYAKKLKRPHIIKLDFIYPDDYTETIVMKAE